ncbi:hypothetical protein GCM10028807_15050 [Spirosoma daeguense]
MKLLSLIIRSFIQRLVYAATFLLVGLTFLLHSYPLLAQTGGNYSTPGLYTYTIPAGGPHQIRLTARGGDGGGIRANNGGGGSGASVGETFSVQSGDVLTVIVGQSGGQVTPTLNGGGGGGSAVILTRNGTRTLLVAGGGGGGVGSQSQFQSTTNYPGGGGRGLGVFTAGTGGPSAGNYSGSGGGGGLAGPGGMGVTGFNPGGGGGAAASLSAVSTGGAGAGVSSGYGGNGFGGGGGVGGYDSSPSQPAGGGGGGYGGGNGAGAYNSPQSVTSAQGGYSYVSPTGSSTTVSPGTSGSGQNQNGRVTLTFPNNTASAAITTANQTVCSGSSVTLQGTISATGSWTLTLSNGSIATGSGASFSIPVSPVSSTTYTIQSLHDQRGIANSNNLTGRTILTTNQPTLSLSQNGPLTCTQTSVTLTATSNATSYTFSSGGTILAGANTSNIRVVNSAGNYVVRVSGANSCTNSATITVTQQVPSPPSVSITNGGTLTCYQPTVTLVAYGLPNAANPIVSYTFTTGSTVLPGDPSSGTRIVSIPGLYRVLVTGANGCTNETETIVNQAPEHRPVVYLTNDGPLSCSKSNTKLTALGDVNSRYYKFIGPGIPERSFSTVTFEFVSSPGTYTVVALSQDGCTSVATTTVNWIGNTITNPTNGSFAVDQGVSEVFNASDGVIPYSNFTVVSGSLPAGLRLITFSPTGRGRLEGVPTQAGSFTAVIQARDANGCTGQGIPYIMNVAPFAITSQPGNKSACLESQMTLSVGILGRPTAYQWYKNTSVIPGQTSATLTLSSFSQSDVGNYFVVITGGGLSLTSTAATLSVLPGLPARLYVKANATGANTGLDWANAFTDLQSALSLDHECPKGLKEIWVAGGVYKPTTTGDRTRPFVMMPGVAIYGGFIGTETTLSQRPSMNPLTGQPSSSTLSGDIGQPGDASDNTQTIIVSVDVVATTVLDGFVISGSKSDPNNEGFVAGSMMNVSSNGSSPTLRNLLFINNNSGGLGGAILNYASSSTCRPTITNCMFQNNSAANGGAIVNYAIGGNCSPILINCSFQSNAASQGGAIYNSTSPGEAATINPILMNCSFQGNTASQGGAIYNSQAQNGTVSLTMVNCALFGNGGVNSITNSAGATLSASYSLFDASVTGYTNGAGNLAVSTSPFTSPTNTQLRAGSPAIDAGNTQAYQNIGGPATDLASNPRFLQTAIDMGAYESPGVCMSMYSLKVGNWNDGSVWSCGRVPQITDQVTLYTAVSLPPSYQGQALRIGYSATGRLLFSAGSRLRLNGN